MSVTKFSDHTPAAKANDCADQLNQAQLAFEAAESLVEDVASNIASFRKVCPDAGGSFGASDGMNYAMACLRSELESLEQEVEQLRAQLNGTHQQAAE